jgi:hypothetical protein
MAACSSPDASFAVPGIGVRLALKAAFFEGRMNLAIKPTRAWHEREQPAKALLGTALPAFAADPVTLPIEAVGVRGQHLEAAVADLRAVEKVAPST